MATSTMESFGMPMPEDSVSNAQNSRGFIKGIVSVMAISVAATLGGDGYDEVPQREKQQDTVSVQAGAASPGLVNSGNFDLQVAIAEAEHQLRMQEEDAAAAIKAAADAAVAEVVQPQIAVRSAVNTGPRPSNGGSIEDFLACTRAHESDTSGGYGAVSPDGQYRGAYQFLQSTWDGAVSRAGFPEYSGVPAERVPANIQDAAAAQLYSERGNQPWGGRC